MRDRAPARALPPGWFAVAGRRDRARVGLAQMALIWLAPWPMMAVGRWAPPGVRHAIEGRWARVTAWAIGLRLEVRGLSQIDPRRTYLVLPLHEGLADPLVLLHLPLPLRFVGRDELARWPILGAYLRTTGQLLVGNRHRVVGRDFLRAARRVVGRGESLVVFPQGSVLGLEVGFRPGALRLARRLRIPVLPVVISGSHRVWEHPFSSRLRLRQRVTLSILPPVGVSGLTRHGLGALMHDLEREMKRVALGDDHAPPRRYLPERDGTWDAYDFVIDPAFTDLARRLPGRVRGREARPPRGARRDYST